MSKRSRKARFLGPSTSFEAAAIPFRAPATQAQTVHDVVILSGQDFSGPPLAVDRGEKLLSQAADLSADLIVAGAYGHARVMELVLGGVTRTLLRAMTVPVLMSH